MTEEEQQEEQQEDQQDEQQEEQSGEGLDEAGVDSEQQDEGAGTEDPA
jgi:hypothetical protein